MMNIYSLTKDVVKEGHFSCSYCEDWYKQGNGVYNYNIGGYVCRRCDEELKEKEA